MFAMKMRRARSPLTEWHCTDPEPGAGEVRLKVIACGLCRTDLHIADGELATGAEGVIPGHQAVGVVDAVGPGVEGLRGGDRLGVPWLGGACGVCPYCREGRENLCDRPQFTGWTRDGGFADTVIARADFCIPIPPGLTDIEAAPLLCAGLIGFRAWRLAAEARPIQRLGLYGFGAAAHLLAQLALHEGQAVSAFTRPGDQAAQSLARDLGCAWTGGCDDTPPEPLDAAIIFAPDGALVPAALAAVRKGGTVVCGGIHMSDIPRFPYSLLWEEREIVSIANLTRADAREFLEIAPQVPVRTTTTTYPLPEANRALSDLRNGRLTGAAVLVP